MSVMTDDDLATIKAQYLPDDAADNGWDDSKIAANWTGGIPGTVRAYWYDRVQQTAKYLDLSDPSGNLPITQIHRQAMEMLQYWDNWLLKNGDVLTIPRRVSFGKIRKRYPKGAPYPVPVTPSSYGPYNYTDT